MTTHTFRLFATLAAIALIGGDALARRPDKPDKPDKSAFGKARSPLVRPTDGPDDNAKGRIDVQRRGNGSDLRVKGQRLDADTAVDVVLERFGDDAGTPGTVEDDFLIASELLAADARTNDDGCVSVAFRTHKGDVLPLSAGSLDDLTGTRISIRVAAVANDGDELLHGTVPLVNADLPKRVRERVDLDRVDEGDSCSGRVQMSFRGKDVRSELRIDVKGLAPDDAVSFRMDDGTGAVVEVGTATANADGQARYRARTHQGDALPFDESTVLGLQGRAIEVWVNASFVDLTPGIPDDPLQEVGLCLTGAVPSDG